MAKFIKEFEHLEEVNEYCRRNNCEPVSITPIAIKNDYKALGATQKVTTVVPTYSYAVILEKLQGSTVEPMQSIQHREQNQQTGIQKEKEKLLNNVKYTEIADELHLSDKQRTRSERWFKLHRGNKPFEDYVIFMELLPWQVEMLNVLVDKYNNINN